MIGRVDGLARRPSLVSLFLSLTLLKVSPINAVTISTINQVEVIADGDDND